MKKTILYISLALVTFLYGQTQLDWNSQLRNRPNITRTGSNATWTDNVTVSGTGTFTGLLAPSNLANAIMACSTSALFTNQTINAALALLPVGGGTVQVCAGHTETLAANIAITKSNTVIQFLGKAAITLGAFQVTVASGSTNVSIFGPTIRSHVTAGTCQGACFDGYTGTGAAISVGDTSGFTENFNITGIGVSLSSAGVGAQAFLFTNVIQSKMNDLGAIGGPVSGQIAYKFLGTGAFFAGLDSLLNPDCNYNVSATNGICIQAAALANAITVVGGHGNMGGSTNGSICFDSLGGSGLFSYGYDCDVAAQALTVESTLDNAFVGYVRIDSGVSGNANWITFAANARGNSIQLNANPANKVTDNGVAGTNSVIYSGNFGWRTDKWQVGAGGVNFLIVDLPTGYAPIAMSIGSNTKISSAPGNDLQLNPNGGSGVSIFNNTNNFKHTFTSVATVNRAVTLPDYAGTLPLTIASGAGLAMTTAAIAAGNCGTIVSASATNTLTTDTITWAFNNTPAGSNAGLVAWPTANNVNFAYCPNSAETPAAASINWRVIR